MVLCAVVKVSRLCTTAYHFWQAVQVPMLGRAWPDEDAWEALVRATTAIPGPSLLELTRANITQYSLGCMSSLDPVLRDVRSVLHDRQPLLAQFEAACAARALSAAFATRREVVNLKKAALTLFHGGQEVETMLTRMTKAMYHSEYDKGADGIGHQSERYVQVSVALQTLKGILTTLFDLRFFTKTLCSISRHHDECREHMHPVLLDPYDRLHARHLLLRVIKFLQTNDSQLPSELAALASTPVEDSGGYLDGPMVDDSMCPEEDALYNDLKSHHGWPDYVVDIFVRNLCSARGAHKAMMIRRCLARFSHAVRTTARHLQRVADYIPKVTINIVGMDKMLCKYRFMIEGCAASLRNVSQWVDQICAGPDLRLFVAGDGVAACEAAMFLPPGFHVGEMIFRQRQLVLAHMQSLKAWLQKDTSNMEVDGPHECRHCRRRVSSMWINRHVCYKCEEERRSRQECPFLDTCRLQGYVCPHEHQCFKCDLGFSCVFCRLLRADGEEVQRLVSTLHPAAVFMDFDRTLATTKGGSSPLSGSKAHSVDPELLNILCCHPNAFILTRNGHTDDIAEFLALQGAPGVRVFSVKRMKATKADVILRHGLYDPAKDRALFIDDTIAEHFDSDLTASPHLIRVLFTRSL